MAWWGRLANVFRAGQIRAEIDEELEHHIAARTAHNLREGMSPEEARAAALRRFGGPLLALDRSHDADTFAWLETVLLDVRFGLRNLRRNPGIAAVAVVSLALAIGANTAIFSVIHAVLLRALPYQDPDRLVLLWVTNALNGSLELNASVPNFEDWKSRNRSFEDLAMYRESDSAFSFNGEPEWIEYVSVHGDFFALLGVRPVLGRVFGAGDSGRHEVVLSDSLWRERFGGAPDAVGRMVTINGVDLEVVGVMPKGFDFPSGDTRLWAPAAAFGRDWQGFRRRRQGGFGTVIGRLRPGIAPAQARAEMELIHRQLAAEYPKDNEERGIRIVPLAAQIHGKTMPFMLALLAGAVLLVLLIACANTANLLLARGAVRRREIALRTALGAGRARVLRQLLTESVLLSTFAAALALPLADWGVRALVALAPHGIARLGEARIDLRVLAFSLGLSFATGILFGIAPAIRITQPVSARRQTPGIESRALRRWLAAGEIALAVVLLTGAGLLVRSFAAVRSVDPGFRADRVLTARLRLPSTLPGARRAALFRQVMARVSQIPGVAAAGGIETLFFQGDQANYGLRAVEGRPAESRDRWSSPLTWSTIGGNYFQALGVPLLRGRFFTDRDTTDTERVVLINETMARRYWPQDNPIGKGIKGFDPRGRNDEWVRVIGVVKDVHNRGLERAPMPQIYEAQGQSLDGAENVVVRGAVSEASLRAALRSIDGTAAWTNVTTLADQFREQTAPRRFQTLLLALFAALALLLAAAGLFATMHYSVSQRTQEIGIRMALGARPGTVLRMVVGEGLALAGVGAAAGLAGSLALSRAIRSLLFEVAPGDPLTLGAVALLLSAIALLACWLPARRATRVDPLLALRHE